MPEVTENYIRIPVSSGHEGHRQRYIDISPEKGIKALYCGECEEIITFLFDKDKWTMSEAKEWIKEHKAKSLAIKSEDEESYTVGGYGIVWGGKDLEREFFESDTDLWLGKLTDAPMVLYDHGQDQGTQKTIVGRVLKTVKDEIGLWIEAQIEKAGKYAEAIRELVKQGKLGWSSGAADYLTEIAADGKILSWPVIEFSLTPWPAEPRTIPVTELRSLAELEPAIKSLLPSDPTVELAVENGQRIIRLHY